MSFTLNSIVSRMRPLPALLLMACLTASTASTASTAARVAQHDAPSVERVEYYDAHSVVRVTVETQRDVRTLLAIAKDVLNHRIDVGPVDVIVDAAGLRALKLSALPLEVRVADLGPLLRADFAARSARRPSAGSTDGSGGGASDASDGGVAGASYFDDFRTLDETYAQLDAWIAARPDLVTPFTIGTSLEGRPIRGIRISKAPAGSPGVLFNATQHAREWGAQTTSMFIADRLIALEGTDARVTALLARAWIDVIPVCNPDGYVYSWTTNRLWRKNRRNNGDGSFGVDLNRNWAFQWGGGGASTNPADETYRGPSAFSEPESAALRDYFISRTTLAGHIDFHAYSQLVLSPWGYTATPPANNAAFLLLGNEMKDAIARTSGKSYTVGPIASTLYVASGSSVDHAYGQHGVPSYTIEVRDTGSYGFVMPVSELVPNAEENFAAALDLADATVDGAVLRLPLGAPATLEYDGPRTITVEARAIRGALTTNPVTLYARVGASSSFTPIAMQETSPSLFAASLPFDACGQSVQWYIAGASTVGTARLPRDPSGTFTTALIETTTTFEETFETNGGWIVGAATDTATGGVWTRVDPIGTAAQPENDSVDAGTFCFVTGQGAFGGAVGAADVDGGTTTLTSPTIPVPTGDARIVYRRWYSNNAGSSPNTDSMPVTISANGGPFVQLELVTDNANAWVERSFRIADVAPSATSLRLRFEARDLGAGSIVEAGVDHVRVLVGGCTAILGDLDGDLDVDAADLAILLGAWGLPGATDLDGDGSTGASDLSIVLGAWG
jgi:murein tripeptide amidase MpaA